MKICDKHWTMLREAIQIRGLMHLVAKEGNEAAARIAEEIKGKEAPYDPLMSCNWMVTNEALRLGGLYLLNKADCCPICEAMEKLNGTPMNEAKELWTSREVEMAWINGPADAALDHCREHQLL
jgi:hypothetical protein